ncbi:MAG: methyl-accepting chemotaxis protein [Proteobacteria bacterium]|nr:methyl-accepting chemotaxis protein [Pseudomonadota bacterium]
MSKVNPLIDQPLDKNSGQLFDWKNHLKMVGDDLYTLAASTEKEFLSVGNNLQDFYNRATAISELSSSLASSMSGNEIVNIINGLRELLNNMQGYIVQAEAEFSQGITALQDIINIVDNIYKPISGFKKIVKTLKILGISTKIESSQLRQDNNGFVTIAEDVEKLSILINSRFTEIFASAGLLENTVKQTLSRVVSLETQQKGKAQSVLDNTHATIASLAEKNTSSVMTAAHISGGLETITGNIGEVVSSMQFHDITRQQLEHIKEALDVLCSRLDAGTNDTNSLEISENNNLKKAIRDTNTVCELQKIQLLDSEENFINAVHRIINNLEGTARNIIGIHEDVQNIAGSEDESSSSFFTKIEGGVLSAISSIREIKNTVLELSITMESLTETVDNMSKFINDIEEIGSEIQLIAVNARIKAAHTGEEGAPLGVIAEAIQNLSGDSGIQKIEVADILKRIVATVETLHQNISLNKKEQETETDILLKNLNGLLERLGRTNDMVKSYLGRIQKEGKALARDIEKVASGITVQEAFSKKIEQAMTVFDLIISQTQELLPEIDNHEKIEMLKNLENNYTMHSERNNHKAYMALDKHKLENIPKNILTSDGSAETGSDLGTNIELF